MKLSIIISARTGGAAVMNCLKSLERLPRQDRMEVIVADCCGGLTVPINAAYPDVRVILTPDLSIAQSRHAAIQLCSGDIAAILHERYAVQPDWTTAVLSAHASDCDVAGGCVAPSRQLSGAGWAMYLSEYSHICPPMPGGPLPLTEAAMLPGGNVSYKKRVFELANMGEALWELDFHAALLQAGARFVRSERMTTEFAHPFTVREYIAERFEVSRDFAALQAQGSSMLRSVATAVTRLALPPLLLARIGRRVFARGYRWQFARAFPWIVIFSVVQTAGEIVGYFSPDQLARKGIRNATPEPSTPPNT